MNLSRRDIVMLMVSLFTSVGGIVYAAPTWHSLATPLAFGGFLMAIAGALTAAFGVEGVQPKDK